MTPIGTEIPGYVVGTWTIDPVRSDVSFTVRNMLVSKVRGRFTTFGGEIVTAADPLASTVTATVDMTSIDTDNERRDEHVRSADFVEVETYPTMTYRSTGMRRDGEGFLVDGELFLHGVTRPVQLHLQVGGFTTDPSGNTRAGFSATAQLNRSDFGMPIAGGVLAGDKITIALEIAATLNTPAG